MFVIWTFKFVFYSSTKIGCTIVTSDSLLIVFVKNLRRGKVKTRLAESVGEKTALQIYRQLMIHTREVVIPVEVDVQVWYSDSISPDDLWDKREQKVEKRTQRGSDLGARMRDAFDSGFSEDYRKIVIIGSDCAELTPEIVEDAFEKLETHDTVIGPSEDGGYYLIGMSSRAPELFEDIAWSTPSVYQATLKKISGNARSLYKLPELNDVDTIEDWQEVAGKFDIRGNKW